MAKQRGNQNTLVEEGQTYQLPKRTRGQTTIFKHYTKQIKDRALRTPLYRQSGENSGVGKGKKFLLH
jgi:hypothetical protein